MQNRNLIIGIGVIIVVVAIGGYLIGTRSGGRVVSGQTSGQGGQGATPVSVPQNYTAIIADIKAKLKDKPNDSDLLFSLADVYFELRRFDEAANYYKKVIEIKPDNPDAYKEAGLALHYMGKSNEGIKYIEEGLKKNPYHQKMWLTKGFILAHGIGDMKAAASAWEKTRTLDPESQAGRAATEYLAQISQKK